MGRKRKLAAGIWEREGVYYARFRARGRLVRKRLSRDYNTALEMLNDLRARADRGEFGLLDNDVSLSELTKEYLRHCEQTCKPKTVQSYRASLKRFSSMVSAKSVAGLSSSVATTYRADRLSQDKVPGKPERGTVSRRTVNKEVGAVATMLAWAVSNKKIGTNPLAEVKSLKHDEKRKERRDLSADEVVSLFDNSPDYLKPVWRMFCCTGIRKGELVAMLFDDVDWERGCVTVRASTAKNHKSREIPLDDILLATLAELREQAQHRQPHKRHPGKFSREHVFVTNANTPWYNNLLTRFYTVCRRAGIEGAYPGGSVDIHALRGTFTSLTLDSGANPKAIQAILGHSSLGLTMSVYAKATERGKRDAINALPFASVKTPEHVIKLPKRHKVSTNEKTPTQTFGINSLA